MELHPVRRISAGEIFNRSAGKVSRVPRIEVAQRASCLEGISRLTLRAAKVRTVLLRLLYTRLNLFNPIVVSTQAESISDMNPYLAYQVRKVLKPVFGIARTYHRNMNGVAKHFRHLGFRPQTIFDVGVARGTYELYSVWPKAKLILVDPVRAFESTMKHICSHRQTPGAYVIAAAGDHDGEITVRCGGDLDRASMRMGGAEVGTMPMLTIDTLAAKFGAAPPYLLKIDVQGAEMEVIKGAAKVLPQSEVVMLEAPLFEFRGLSHSMSDLIVFMKERGFVPFDIYDGLCPPVDRSLGQIDIAFVKSDGRFREVNTWETHEQRERIANKTRLRKILGL